MANLGRAIDNINTLTSFTAKVVYAASERYGQTQAEVTFQVGYEYSGKNFFKGSTRPPKLRILSIFQPLINGNPNTNNDTYVAFQIYDYTLSVWRGPWCKKSNISDASTYVDYFITTIDSFGRKYGNQYTGSGSSVTTFTPPQVFLSSKVGISLGRMGMIQINKGHNPSIFTLGGNTNKMYHFHGFISMDGPYSTGMWCFYSISANGQGTSFNHLLDVAPYNTGVYPNVLPKTNKLTNEWRVTTTCSLLDAIGYNPRININNTGLGPIKYYPGPDPGNAFPVDNVFPTEVWCEYDPGNPSSFFLTPLWSPGGDEYESEQGIATSYAPAGWYGTSAEDSYAYWDGLGNWMLNSYATYSVVVTLTGYTISEPYPTFQMACQQGKDGKKYQVYSSEKLDILFIDSAASMPYNGVPNMWYLCFETMEVFTMDGNRVIDIFPC
mgnify:CR=1 FL=1|jgi:hypothetical protein